jgi:ATP synthase protein I
MKESSAENSGAGGDGDGRNARSEQNAAHEQALKKRLDTLGARIREARSAHAGKSPAPDSRGSAMGAAFKLATEMVAGVAVGGGMGYFADKFAGTSPFLLILFLLLGGAAGIMNAVRVAKEMQKAVEKAERDETSN